MPYLSWKVPSMLSGHTTKLLWVEGEKGTGHSWGSAFIRVQSGMSRGVNWLIKNMRMGIRVQGAETAVTPVVSHLSSLTCSRRGKYWVGVAWFLI